MTGLNYNASIRVAEGFAYQRGYKDRLHGVDAGACPYAGGPIMTLDASAHPAIRAAWYAGWHAADVHLLEKRWPRLRADDNPLDSDASTPPPPTR